MTLQASRRAFLKASAGLAAVASSPAGVPFQAGLGLSLAGLGALAAQSAQAADTSGYKALVCLFMAGGNDSHNWVVPMDSAGYAEYAAVRRELAWPVTQLRMMSSTGQSAGRLFGMPAELAPLRALYEAGNCAVVANVGPLERPTSQADFLAGNALPRKLFSHNDQQSTWQSLAPEGATSGWGGRMGDILMAANQYPAFTAVSASGNAVFLTGANVSQYQVMPSGPVVVESLERASIHGSTQAAEKLRQAMSAAGTSPFQNEHVKVTQRSLATASTLRQALAETSVSALPTRTIPLTNGKTLRLDTDPLALQLKIVAHMIAAGQRLGMGRQVFMVQMGGFDTHANQMRDQPLLMAKVANGVNWFMSALAAQGMQQNVTLFTASDFGRTLTTNGSGSDHGWGSHHLVVGGAVRGRQIAGRMPVCALGTADDVGSGRLLPSTSVVQLAAQLGQWMGLSDSELRYALPTLSAFDNNAIRLF